MLLMTFPNPAFPLTQLTEFEVGETLGINTSVDEDDTYYESYQTFIEVYDFDATLVGRSYEDVVVTVPASPDMVDNISPNPLDAFHGLSSYSLPFPSPECRNISLVNYHEVLEGNVVDCLESLGTLRGYDLT